MQTETEDRNELDRTTTEVRATDMAQVGSTLVLSSSNGELLLTRISCFYSAERSEREWALSRSYRAHASQVSAVMACSVNSK